jgi:DNA-binding response OmpR family regulator
MNILFFENLNDCLKNIKDNIIKNIIVTHLSNFESIEQSGFKIDNLIFYLTSKKNNINIKTKFQKYELIYCPFELNNFIEKINLACNKSRFAINSKVKLLNYTINLNAREIIAGQNKLKLTEREKDFLLFLKNSKEPQTIRNILESVWRYSKGMETHTVETHVHRLRKKILDSFNDNNFIKNNKKGYYI